MLSSFTRRLLLSTSGLLVAAVGAHATSFVMMSDEALVDDTDVIVVGTITSVAPAPTDRPMTEYAVHVERLLAGGLPGTEIVVRVVGGDRHDGTRLVLHGAPQFRPEDRVLLFLSGRTDGTFRVRHLMLGAFHIIDAGEHSVALRNLDGLVEYTLDGERRESPTDMLRDADRFAGWIDDRAAGRPAVADYLLPADAIDTTRILDRFTLISIGSRNARFFQFDSGGRVTWRASTEGQIGLAGGGYAEFQSALAAWRNEPLTPVDLRYGGTTGASGGFRFSDGQNTMLFNDPFGDIDGSYSCGTGGVLAAGGPWTASNATGTFRGDVYLRILEADIVGQNGLDCFLGSPGASLTMAEILAHEVGHTLGLGHSCGDDFSGPCNTPEIRRALMRATIHDDGRGARLEADDRDGLRFLYQVATASPPNAPSEFSAEHLNSSAARLDWVDASGNENGFRVYRALGDVEPTEVLAQLPANAQSFVDPTVTDGVTYSYRVAAFNGQGEASSPTTTVTPSPFVTSDQLPGFGVRVELSTPNGTMEGRKEADCLSETICFSGAVPGRAETFVRVVGPKPNGYLWPTLVKFSTATAEIEIVELATDQRKTYILEGATPGVDSLPGMFDRLGFLATTEDSLPLVDTITVWPLARKESAVLVQREAPVPPDREPMTTDEIPGFQFWVQITNQQGEVIETRAEADCIAETLCASGAVLGRSEVFLRIVGPKPNGYLWPTLVRFSTARIEIWIEQIASGELAYYELEAPPPGTSDISGAFDRETFLP